MKHDEHLRTALRHAPDAGQQAPQDLGAQVMAAAHRAAAKTVRQPGRNVSAAQPASRPSLWAAWFGGRPVRLGASGAVASVLLAGVIGLMWQAAPPGPAREQAGDGGASTVATPERTAEVAQGMAAPAPQPARPSPAAAPPARAAVLASANTQTRAQAVPLPTLPPSPPSTNPPSVPPVHRQAQADAAAAPAPAAIAQAVAPAFATATPPLPRLAAAQPAAAPMPGAELAADTTNAAGGAVRPTVARAAAAPPPPLRARALALAATPPPWATLVADQTAPSWRVDGVDLPLDRAWLTALAQHTQGRWSTKPAASPGPDAFALVWLQGDGVAARLWLGATHATWCTPQAGCQAAALPEAVAAELIAALKKKLPR